MANNRDMVVALSSTWMQGPNGEAFCGLCIGLCADALAEGASQALRLPWTNDPAQPDDALPLLASERALPIYAGELTATHRLRLADAWTTYSVAGDETSIESQLALAGYAGQVVFFPGLDGPNGQPAPYWSQFWILFPHGTHPVTSEGFPWDSFDWDDGSAWGPIGYTESFSSTLHGIVRKWKPGHWICRGFIFENGEAEWDGFLWDDGTAWNGAIEIEF